MVRKIRDSPKVRDKSRDTGVKSDDYDLKPPPFELPWEIPKPKWFSRGERWYKRFKGTPPQKALVPIPGTPFYHTPTTPADPFDCDRYPDSLYCGSNPFTAKPIAYDFSIVKDKCNLGIELNGALGFVKMPRLQFVYRDPDCRPDEPPPMDLPPPKPPGEGWFFVPGSQGDGYCVAHFAFWVRYEGQNYVEEIGEGIGEFYSYFFERGKPERSGLPEGYASDCGYYFPTPGVRGHQIDRYDCEEDSLARLFLYSMFTIGATALLKRVDG